MSSPLPSHTSPPPPLPPSLLTTFLSCLMLTPVCHQVLSLSMEKFGKHGLLGMRGALSSNFALHLEWANGFGHCHERLLISGGLYL